jgi:hypothetical protein
MKYLNSFSASTKAFILVTLAALAYGYLCRLLGIYFFWESKTIGWTLFWVAIIWILMDRIKAKKLQNKATVLEKIGIGLSIFVILIKGILFFSIQQTDIYASALTFVKQDKDVRDQVGDIKGIFFVPFGGFSMSSGPQGTQGEADLHLIVKGQKKYIDLNLLMKKELDTDWKILINR